MFREAVELLRANKPNHAKYLEGLPLSRSKKTFWQDKKPSGLPSQKHQIVTTESWLIQEWKLKIDLSLRLFNLNQSFAGLRDGSGCLACKQDCHTNWLCLFFSVPHTRWKYIKVITKKYFTGENIYALVKCFCINCVCNQHQFSTYYFHNMFSLFWHIKLICLHPNIIFRPQGHFLDPLKSRLVCS